MYTILIVDDEQLAREDVSYSVGASEFPFHWIMEAASGEEALEIVEANRPDILLTDIKMGEVSGLDLIQQAKEIHPNMVSVIICGYPDFEYAQRAVTLGVCDYLLKPVKKEEIKKVLLRATQEVRSHWDRQNMSKANYLFKRTLEENKTQETMNAFISSGGKEFADQMTASLRESMWCRMMILRLPSDDALDFDISASEERGLLSYGVHNIAAELTNGETANSALIANSIEHENVIISVLTSTQEKQELAADEMLMLAGRIKRSIDKAYNLHTSASISGTHNELDADVYTEALLALDTRFSIPEKAESSVLVYDSFKDNLALTSQEETFAILRKLLSVNDIEKASSLVSEMILSFKNNPDVGIRTIYSRIINALSVACYKNGKSILQLLGSENISGSILNTFDSLDEIAENLKNIITSNLQSVSRENDSASGVMKQIKQYIDNSFTDSELSTNKLSKEFCISLGYLSASYKKEHGITISKYIISKRINYAEKLLKETELSVSEIAETSGFNNLSYFMRLFKNAHNLTPSQYRSANASTDA